jgi:hypothetical protein
MEENLGILEKSGSGTFSFHEKVTESKFRATAKKVIHRGQASDDHQPKLIEFDLPATRSVLDCGGAPPLLTAIERSVLLQLEVTSTC